MRALLILAALLFGAAARAETVRLFILEKPKNPENLVQTFITVDENCQLGNLDFYWLRLTPFEGYAYNKDLGGFVKTPNRFLRCNLLKRLKAHEVPAQSKAGCRPLPKGVVCSDKAVYADEFEKVDNSTPIVIRSYKSMKDGTCKVGAYLDIGGKAVQISRVNLKGSATDDKIPTITFASVQAKGMADEEVANWKCVRNCVERPMPELLCNLGY